MPRKPKATRPKAKIAGAIISAASPSVLMPKPMPISTTIARPIQKAEKLPATMPERMSSEGPPCWAETTTSVTCRDLTEVKALTSSGISAPASVPQLMMIDSFHHRPSGKSPISTTEVTKVSAMHTALVNQTRFDSGRSKSISSASA